MAHTVNLYQRDDTFYFRFRIPTDLKHHFGKREEVKRSLRTRKLTHARRMVKLLTGRTEELFTKMRCSGSRKALYFWHSWMNKTLTFMMNYRK
jgi:hypothetical protein